MADASTADTVTVIEDARKARAVLPPLRQQILAAAQEPCSATAIAAQLGLPRQRVNYHVRQLAAAGFLKRAGRRQRRGLVEQRWVAASKHIVLAPQLDEALAVDHAAVRESAAEQPDVGATYLLALAATVQREVALGARTERRRGKSLPTFALDAEVGFANAAQRAKFAAAIQRGIEDAIVAYSTTEGPRYRMAFGVYPIPERKR